MTHRAVWLRRELDRAETSNDGTLLPSFFPILNADRGPGLEVGTSFEKAFLAHYAAIRELLNAHEEQGLGLVAAGPDGLEASVWFVAKPDEANPLILGRHSSAEVFLPSDPALSLRHLAVILHRQGVGSPVRFRVLDLRTPNGFQDERGRSLEALGLRRSLDDPVRLSFAVMMFPTGGGNPPWPEDPHQAWARVPERLYTAARVAGGRACPRTPPGSGIRVPSSTWPTPVRPPSSLRFPAPRSLPGTSRRPTRRAASCWWAPVRGRRLCAWAPLPRPRASCWAATSAATRPVSPGSRTAPSPGPPARHRARRSPLCRRHREHERLLVGQRVHPVDEARAGSDLEARPRPSGGVAALPLIVR